MCIHLGQSLSDHSGGGVYSFPGCISRRPRCGDVPPQMPTTLSNKLPREHTVGLLGLQLEATSRNSRNRSRWRQRQRQRQQTLFLPLTRYSQATCSPLHTWRSFPGDALGQIDHRKFPEPVHTSLSVPAVVVMVSSSKTAAP